jgi:hypothetical protein
MQITQTLKLIKKNKNPTTVHVMRQMCKEKKQLTTGTESMS